MQRSPLKQIAVGCRWLNVNTTLVQSESDDSDRRKRHVYAVETSAHLHWYHQEWIQYWSFGYNLAAVCISAALGIVCFHRQIVTTTNKSKNLTVGISFSGLAVVLVGCSLLAQICVGSVLLDSAFRERCLAAEASLPLEIDPVIWNNGCQRCFHSINCMYGVDNNRWKLRHTVHFYCSYSVLPLRKDIEESGYSIPNATPDQSIASSAQLQ